ncbi:universal stress protein [Bdellovibrio sp. HCB209]|uniref:universal stress protein n=1 Tax=Bdellovibrio sp. HCB209 TaxID=3394354 RepID=UPI0039B3927A
MSICLERIFEMKRAVIALNPRASENDSLKNFCEQIKILQENGLWDEIFVLSVIHQSYFPYSPDDYDHRRERILQEVRQSLYRGISDKIDFHDVDVLECHSSGDEEVVRLMASWVIKKRSQVLVLGVDIKHISSRWSLEGIPVTAAFLSPVPLLVVNVREPFDFVAEKEPKVLLAVDATAPPSAKALRRLTRLAKPLKAKVHLVNVTRRKTMPVLTGTKTSEFDRVREVLHDTSVILQNFGVESIMEVVKENESVANTIAEYVKKNNIWVAAVTSPVRSIKHRLAFGSTTQAMLGHLGCPLLVLRTR